MPDSMRHFKFCSIPGAELPELSESPTLKVDGEIAAKSLPNLLNPGIPPLNTRIALITLPISNYFPLDI